MPWYWSLASCWSLHRSAASGDILKSPSSSTSPMSLILTFLYFTHCPSITQVKILRCPAWPDHTTTVTMLLILSSLPMLSYQSGHCDATTFKKGHQDFQGLSQANCLAITRVLSAPLDQFGPNSPQKQPSSRSRSCFFFSLSL